MAFLNNDSFYYFLFGQMEINMKEISNSEIVFDKSGNEEMVSRLGKAIPKKMNFAIGLIDFCHYFLFGQIKKRMREISYSEIVFHKND